MVPALVCSLLWLFGVGSLIGVICGHVVLGNIRRSRGWLRGEGIAIIALVFGYTGLLTALMVILVLMALCIERAPSAGTKPLLHRPSPVHRLTAPPFAARNAWPP